jgi:hypothetical protein
MMGNRRQRQYIPKRQPVFEGEQNKTDLPKEFSAQDNVRPLEKRMEKSAMMLDVNSIAPSFNAPNWP